MQWQPTANLAILKKRSELLQLIRDFFVEKNVLEVETPLIANTAVTDPHIIAIPVQVSHGNSTTISPAKAAQQQNNFPGGKSPLHSKGTKGGCGTEIHSAIGISNASPLMYLQTSPEYAMKRLLAAGSGSIYQICKAFRQGEQGKQHNLEFTMLEWYRLGFDHHALMAEVAELLCRILPIDLVKKISYQELFEQLLQLNPHTASIAELKNCALQKGIQLSTLASAGLRREDWLDILLTNCIEPTFTDNTLWMVYDYPAEQAALAKIKHKDEFSIAERFEVYFQGIELANGYHELTNAEEQLARFQQDCIYRQKLGYPAMQIDEHLLAALQAGLPECAGVAVGIDRLMMLALNKKSIQEVIAFIA